MTFTKKVVILHSIKKLCIHSKILLGKFFCQISVAPARIFPMGNCDFSVNICWRLRCDPTRDRKSPWLRRSAIFFLMAEVSDLQLQLDFFYIPSEMDHPSANLHIFRSCMILNFKIWIFLKKVSCLENHQRSW